MHVDAYDLVLLLFLLQCISADHFSSRGDVVGDKVRDETLFHPVVRVLHPSARPAIYVPKPARTGQIGVTLRGLQVPAKGMKPFGMALRMAPPVMQLGTESPMPVREEEDEAFMKAQGVAEDAVGPAHRLPIHISFETEPTFQPFHVDSGTVRVYSAGQVIAAARCQFAAFGPREFSGTSFRLRRAEPIQAERSLHQPLEGAIALVERGKCSFEAKMRRAAAAGAAGVILINNEDTTFVALPDSAAAGSQAAEAAARDIPIVVVSASAAARITSAYDIQEQAGKDVSVSVTMLASDEELGNVLRLPLFPVAQTLLPGQTMRMQVTRAERLSLQTRFRLALEGPQDDMPVPEDIGVPTVAVVLVGDASSNLVASVGTMAHVDLQTLREEGSHLTLRGVAPCNMRCLVRESTPKTIGLALVQPLDAGNWTFSGSDGNPMTRSETGAELRATIRRVGAAAQHFHPVSYVEGGSAPELARLWDELPTDLSMLTFVACSLLGLGAKREQAALQCRLPERVRVLRRLLRKLETKYATALPSVERSMGGSPSLVAAAVARAAPWVVIVEAEGEGRERAAGFVVHPDGLIITNRHVANSTRPASVIFEDGGRAHATVVGESRDYDIAFLRVPRDGLAAAVLGNSDQCAVGDWVVAIGHPAEFERLVTVGIVSAIQRPMPTGPGVSPHAMLDRAATFIATDALFNKGISGGPLLNERGEVIGMNTYLRRDLEGLGFAIAVDRIRETASELLDVEI